jgi:hypothetical protein
VIRFQVYTFISLSETATESSPDLTGLGIYCIFAITSSDIIHIQEIA